MIFEWLWLGGILLCAGLYVGVYAMSVVPRKRHRPDVDRDIDR